VERRARVESVHEEVKKKWGELSLCAYVGDKDACPRGAVVTGIGGLTAVSVVTAW
jgi:hypothetical protein